jgi:hypothetical protein
MSHLAVHEKPLRPDLGGGESIGMDKLQEHE